MFCPKCGKQLPDDAVFCGSCGTKLGNVGNVPQPSSAPYGGSQQVVDQSMSHYSLPPAADQSIARYSPPQAACATAPRRRRVWIAAPIALAVVALIVVGLATSCFGLFNAPVYVLTTYDHYSSDGDLLYTTAFELDSSGNATKYTYSGDYISNDSFDIRVFDKDGFLMGGTSKTSDDDSESYSVSSTFDSSGHVATQKYSSGRSIDYEYNSGGKLSHMVSTDGYFVFEYYYDENGYPIKFTLYTASAQSDPCVDYTYAWEFSNGKAVGYSENNTEDGGERHYSCECDGDGNITKITSDDGSYATCTYQKISSPSEFVRETTVKLSL